MFRADCSSCIQCSQKELELRKKGIDEGKRLLKETCDAKDALENEALLLARQLANYKKDMEARYSLYLLYSYNSTNTDT